MVIASTPLEGDAQQLAALRARWKTVAWGPEQASRRRSPRAHVRELSAANVRPSDEHHGDSDRATPVRGAGRKRRAPARTRLRDLLDGVVAAREDDAPRRVYADALIEAGEPQGELINIQCDLAHGGLARDEANELNAHAHDHGGPDRTAALVLDRFRRTVASPQMRRLSGLGHYPIGYGYRESQWDLYESEPLGERAMQILLAADIAHWRRRRSLPASSDSRSRRLATPDLSSPRSRRRGSAASRSTSGTPRCCAYPSYASSRSSGARRPRGTCHPCCRTCRTNAGRVRR